MGRVLCVQEDFWLPEHPCVTQELHGWEPPKRRSREGNIPAGLGPMEQPPSRGAARPRALVDYKLEELCHEKSRGFISTCCWKGRAGLCFFACLFALLYILWQITLPSAPQRNRAALAALAGGKAGFSIPFRGQNRHSERQEKL